MKKLFAIAAMAAMLIACGEKEDDTNNPTPGPGPNPDINETNLPECLKGSDYYPIVMDAVTFGSIESKVAADLRVDDFNTHLWIWENTYVAGTSTGPNYFGEVEGWVALQVGSVGWSGAGFCCYDPAKLSKLADITANPADYVLHLAMKSQDAATHEFVFYSDSGAEAKLAVDVDGVYGYARDGEWHAIEVPMTYFTNNGLLWTSALGAGSVPGNNVDVIPTGGHNVMAVLSGASGSLNLDACFIYKPAK
ncbi:MAG: hypothetical protein J6K24_03490 [Tidjanibacter sp.]|nr:hypothetical protein [Tidjanibacter sp.]